MSSNYIVTVHSLSKTFYQHATAFQRIARGFGWRSKNKAREFVALQDVSFDVTRGETIGIVGRNGAGKSTLLQILCGIRKPTSGTVSVKGRVVGLLELGAGFHPELTGRENAYMLGAILGISDNEISARMAEIISFSEIGNFIDFPVRTYSSGMYLRLAFSANVHFSPDILIIDEALAVGDMTFQNKCMRKMAALISEGKTIFLVSHNLSAIRLLCNRAIYLDNGKIVDIGDAKKVCDGYEKAEIDKVLLKNKTIQNTNGAGGEVSEYSPCQITSVKFLLNPIDNTADFHFGQEISCEINISCESSLLPVSIGVSINSPKYSGISRLNNVRDGEVVNLKQGMNRIILTMMDIPLLTGVYDLSFYLSSSSLAERFHAWENVLAFSINSEPTDKIWAKYGGLVAIKHRWTVGHD